MLVFTLQAHLVDISNFMGVSCKIESYRKGGTLFRFGFASLCIYTTQPLQVKKQANQSSLLSHVLRKNYSM